MKNRDSSHEDFVVRWANFVRNNPDKWRHSHSRFLNSQIINSWDFIKRLSKQPGGSKKIIELYSIKNTSGYLELFES